MLRCRLTCDDLGQSWHWSAGRWTAGGSWIEPYAHPILEHGLVTDGARTFMTVRERLRDTGVLPTTELVDSTAYGLRLAEAKSWPLDFVLVECSRGRGVFTAGVWGTAPVYLVPIGSSVRGSWDLMELRRHLRADVLVDAVVGRLLTYWRRYSRDTVWRDAVMLTERARATFGREGLTMVYPEPAAHSRAREMREGQDPINAMEALLTSVLAQRAFDPAASAVELSGGLDSANVAMTLAANHPGELASCGMLIGGPAGEQQRRRRTKMIKSAAFARDIRIQGMAFPPLHPGGPRGAGQPVHPDEEPFAEATTAMLDSITARGARVAFTGIGGDEMLSLREWEREQPLGEAEMRFPGWLTSRTVDALLSGEARVAPASVITEVTLLGFACRWPLYLRAGIWPVSPLAAPDLTRFGEWLPVEWRRRKRIYRARLSRLGLSEEVVNPAMRENLSGIMGRGMRRYGIPSLRAMLSDSLILADLGYVNTDRLREACDHAERVDEPDIDRRLFPVISLELALRAMTHR